MNSRYFKLYRAYSNSFNSSNVGKFCRWRLYLSSGKEKKSRCLHSRPRKKREIRHFHVVVVQRQQRNVQKSVMHLQSCWFANLLLLFCRSRCRCRRCRRRRSLSSLFFWRKYAIRYPTSEALNDGFLLSEYIANTFWAVQSTFRPLEMHSDRRYKISICSAIFRELESFRHYKGFSIIFSKTLDAIWSWFLSPHIFEIHNFRFPLSTKYSLSCGRKCEKLNCRKS